MSQSEEASLKKTFSLKNFGKFDKASKILLKIIIGLARILPNNDEKKTFQHKSLISG